MSTSLPVGSVRRSRRGIALRALAAIALAGVALMVTGGCAAFRDYRERTRAEELFGAGAFAAENNQLATADADFADALAIAPNSASLRARIGLAYVRMRPAQYARAFSHLRRAIEMDGKQPAIIYRNALLAAVLLDQDEWGRRLVPRIAQRFHNDGMALNDIGYTLADADRLVADVLPLLRRAAALEPRSAAVIDSLGWAYYRLDDLSRAATTLERATRLAVPPPEANAEIYYHLGVVYADLHRTADARRQFEKALRAAPTFDRARIALNDLSAQ